MKTLISKSHNNYTVSVVTTDDGVLAVRMDNKDNEFIGQMFVNRAKLSDRFLSYTNGEVALTDEDLKSIDSELSSEKNESSNVSGALFMSLSKLK